MSEIRFYIDENVDAEVAVQLANGGIDAVSVLQLEELGDTDINHLQRATEMGRVLCTHDQDFLRMNAEGVKHAGIAFAPAYGATIGGLVRELSTLHAAMTAEEMVGQVKFLSVR